MKSIQKSIFDQYFMRIKISLVCFVLFAGSCGISAQEYQGTGGLLHVPSAETDSAGTFRGWVMFLDDKFHPFTCEGQSYPTVCYGIGLVAWEWFEASFVQALIKEPKYGDYGPVGYYNQDRHINVKIRPLKEKRWWPSVAIGWDDIGNFKIWKSITANNNFENIYLAITKHFSFHHVDMGLHMAYRYYPAEQNRKHQGVVGGLTLVPNWGETAQKKLTWLRPPRLILEWDGAGINVGADVLLWRHLLIQGCLVHGCGFSGGMSYHYTIPF